MPPPAPHCALPPSYPPRLQLLTPCRPAVALSCSPRAALPLPRAQKYYNVRASYISAFFDVINWKGVSDAYAKAKAGAEEFATLDVLKPAANWED